MNGANSMPAVRRPLAIGGRCALGERAAEEFRRQAGPEAPEDTREASERLSASTESRT